MDARTSTDSTPKKTRARRGYVSARQRAKAQEAFLAAYAETGIITTAALAAGVDRKTIYNWQEHDEAFSLRFYDAEATANDLIRAEILRRAYEGVEEPVFQLGKYAGTIRKYSDTLLIFEAKRRMPEYRDKVDVKTTVQGNLSYDITASPEAALYGTLFAAALGSADSGSADDPGGPRIRRE